MNVKKCKVVSHACEHAEFLSVQGLEPNPTQKISSLLARFLHSLLGRLGRLGLGRCTRFGLTALQSDISGRLILVLGVVLLCIPAMGHGRKYYHSLSIYASVVSWSQHILIYIYIWIRNLKMFVQYPRIGTCRTCGSTTVHRSQITRVISLENKGL